MSLFSEDRVFTAQTAIFNRTIFTIALAAFLSLLAFCGYAIIITFVEVLELFYPERRLFFFEKGQALGAILMMVPLFAIIVMFCPAFINRRFKPSILVRCVKIGTAFMIVSVPAMITGSIYTESYLEAQGYVKCGYYSSTSYTSNDFYVYDPRFCNEEGTLVSSEVRGWLEAQNGKASPNHDEFLAVISQALEERDREIYGD